MKERNRVNEEEKRGEGGGGRDGRGFMLGGCGARVWVGSVINSRSEERRIRAETFNRSGGY